jgi:hypothetical protein
MIWLVLASLISAESCIDIESCERNIEISEDLIVAINDSDKISEEDKKTFTGYLRNGIDNIIKRDLEEFKKEKGD